MCISVYIVYNNYVEIITTAPIYIYVAIYKAIAWIPIVNVMYISTLLLKKLLRTIFCHLCLKLELS